MWSEKPSFTFVIDNFSEKEAALTSQLFVSGGCEWYLRVCPKGESSFCDYDHMYLFLIASDPIPSQTGWKRKARFYFSVLNQSRTQLCLSPIASGNTVFSAKAKSWGFKALSHSELSKFQEDGLLENDKLIIEVYINNVEVDDGEKKETLDINGFQAFASHVNSVMKKTFTEYAVKKDYMNAALSNACNKVSELAEEGYKMDWLKSKLDDLSSKMRKLNDAERSQIHQVEELIKNLEVMGLDLKMECSTLKSKLEEVSQKSNVQQLEERIKNLEQMGSGFKVHFEEIYMERRKAYDAAGSQVQQLEERIKNLELVESGERLDNLESQLEGEAYELRLQEIDERLEDLEEAKESDEDYEERLEEIDERLENLETLVSDLKDELDP